MSKQLEIARHTFLESAGLSDSLMEGVLNDVLGHNIDYADLYFQTSRHESWALEDSIVKEASHNTERGVGVRAISGEKTGFAYSDDIILPALEKAASAAKSIARIGQHGKIAAWNKNKPYPQLYPALDPLPSMVAAAKVQLLHDIDHYVRSKESRVTQVMAGISGLHEVIMVMASDGTFAGDVRPLVRLNIQVIVEVNGRREQGFAGFGGRYDLLELVKDNRWHHFADEAVRQALLNLEAIDAPAGMMPVVLGPGWPGVLLHEAIGHGLEGDFNRKGSSAFSGRIGERVASPLCTIVDDGTLSERRGSLSIDDEGTVTECTTLIENGILRGYMQDKLNARLMGSVSTGNGRRESYAHLPMPRMTNTYMLNGPHNPDEIIRSVKKGLYAVNFGGGQVDITSGKFVFSASEAYLIENGKITTPVKGATLIGSGPDVLKHVSMVGNDLKLDEGIGVCGKEGQSVPVGVGQPTLKIDKITVGGTKG